VTSAPFPDRVCAKGFSEHRLRGSSTQTDDNEWLNDGDFRLEPRPACRDLGVVRFLVDTTLSLFPALPLEVLHYIRDVDLLALNARVIERSIKELSSGTYEGTPLDVFAVAGLFADEHDLSRSRPFAEDGLRANFPEMTRAAASGRRA
jgi:hypothetical protein